MDKFGPLGLGTITTTPANPTTTTSFLCSTSEWKDYLGATLVAPFNIVVKRVNQNALYNNSEEIRVLSFNGTGVTSCIRARNGTTALSLRAGDLVYPSITQLFRDLREEGPTTIVRASGGDDVAALNAACLLGGTVYLPDPVYLIGSTWNAMPVDGISVQGRGHGNASRTGFYPGLTQIKRFGSFTGLMVKCGGVNPQVNRGKFLDISVNCQEVNSVGIQIQDIFDAKFRVAIHEPTAIGLEIGSNITQDNTGGSHWLEFDHCYIQCGLGLVLNADCIRYWRDATGTYAPSYHVTFYNLIAQHFHGIGLNWEAGDGLYMYSPFIWRPGGVGASGPGILINPNNPLVYPMSASTIYDPEITGGIVLSGNPVQEPGGTVGLDAESSINGPPTTTIKVFGMMIGNGNPDPTGTYKDAIWVQREGGDFKNLPDLDPQLDVRTGLPVVMNQDAHGALPAFMHIHETDANAGFKVIQYKQITVPEDLINDFAICFEIDAEGTGYCGFDLYVRQIVAGANASTTLLNATMLINVPIANTTTRFKKILATQPTPGSTLMIQVGLNSNHGQDTNANTRSLRRVYPNYRQKFGVWNSHNGN